MYEIQKNKIYIKSLWLFFVAEKLPCLWLKARSYLAQRKYDKNYIKSKIYLKNKQTNKKYEELSLGLVTLEQTRF